MLSKNLRKIFCEHYTDRSETLSVVAVPNVSRDGEPIHFQVNLVNPANLNLELFTVSGEMIFKETLQGEPGLNKLKWGLENKMGSQVASGLYIYVIQVDDGMSAVTKIGKVVVLH